MSIGNNMITAIDIGTNLIKGLSVAYNHETSNFEVMAKVIQPVSGVRKGVVSNVEETSKAITECIKNIEIQTNSRIDGVYANLNGSHIVSSSSRGQVAVSRADQKISSEDIDRVIAAAKIFPISRNREIVDAFPREFIIDGVGGIRDPLDMQGIRFEADVMIVEVFSQYIKNTTQAILDSNVRVNDLIPGVLSSAQSVLEPNEKERGVAILDIGAGTTSLAVFEENTLLHIAIFPIGSNNITNDIAIGLKCDIDTAEKIKIEFGSAINSKGDTKKEKAISQEGEEIIFTKTALRRIINARVCEIFEVVNEELKKISKDRLLPAGVVLTGGGSSLPGISDLARKELKLPARVGFAKRFNPLIDDPRFSVVCGLAMIGYEIEEEEEGSWSKAKRKVKNFFKSLIP